MAENGTTQLNLSFSTASGFIWEFGFIAFCSLFTLVCEYCWFSDSFVQFLDTAVDAAKRAGEVSSV